MLMEYKSLSMEFWGRHMWTRGYFVASSATITDEVIIEYIELQSKEPTVNDFTVNEKRVGLRPRSGFSSYLHEVVVVDFVP